MKKNLIFKQALAAATLMTFVATNGPSAVILAFDVQGQPGTEVSLASSTTDADLATTTGLNALTRGPAGGGAGTVPLATAAGNSFDSTTWNITNTFNQNTNFLTFSLAPIAGQQLTLTSLQFALNGSNTAPGTGLWGYSTDGGTTFTLESPTISLTNPAVTSLTTWTLTGFTPTTNTVIFRFWAYGTTSINAGTASAGGTVRVQNIAGNDLVVNGVFTAIPEPATYALIAVGLTGLVVFRRRRIKSA